MSLCVGGRLVCRSGSSFLTGWPSVRTDINAARLEELTVENRRFKTRDFLLYWTFLTEIYITLTKKNGDTASYVHTNKQTYIHTYIHTYTLI
jgi:hypothetical protein